MGGNVLKKLRSSKGASLTFALLAFLVCAVISAVLLASASAAAGRLSGLAESDKRYYAVNSAVQLFCGDLKEEPFVIEQTHKHTEYTETRSVLQDNGEWYTWEVPTPPEDVYILKVDNNEDVRNPKSEIDSFWKEAALYYIFGDSLYTITNSSFLLDAAMTDSPKGGAKDWSLSFTVSGEADLTVYALAFMDQRGNITMYFSNAPFDEIAGATVPDKKYYVKAEFGINASMDYPYTQPDYTYDSTFSERQQTVKITTKTTLIKKATVNWTVSSVSTMEKAAVDAELDLLKPAPAEENEPVNP